MADFYRMVKKCFDESGRKLDELTEMRATKQCLAGLEEVARQPRLATEADVRVDKKIRKRMDKAAADHVRHEDRCSTKRVQAGPTSSTSFGMKAEPPAPSRRDTILVNKGPVAPKLCRSSVKVRTLTFAGYFARRQSL